MSHILLDENAIAPSTPASGKTILYPKTDGLWYTKDDAGTETAFALPVPVSVANGGTALTALGSALQVLRVNAGATALEYAASSGGAPGTSTITTTGTQTALAIPTGDADLIIFANNATLLTLQGITAGADGQRLTIFSIGAGQVDVANQNASASAANRIINMIAGTVSLAAGTGRMDLVYDSTTARWRVITHDQGAFINYYSSSTVVGWSSFTGGRTDIWYKVIGRIVKLKIHLEGTSNSTAVTFTVPFTSTNIGYGSWYGTLSFTYDNGAYATSPGKFDLSVNSATVTAYFNNAPGTTWTASGTKIAAGSFDYEAA